MKKLSLLLAILCFVSPVLGSHFMGGYITWRTASGPGTTYNFVFELHVYRDCSGSSYQIVPETLTFNVQPSMAIATFKKYVDNSPLCGDSTRQITCPSASYFGKIGSISEIIYETGVVSFPVFPLNGIVIECSSINCCRISYVNSTCSTPYFRSVIFPTTTAGVIDLPSIYLDNGYHVSTSYTQIRTSNLSDTSVFSSTMNDPDGDRLVFEFADPQNSFATTCSYSNGFSLARPFPLIPVNGFGIDSSTGEVFSNNSMTGAFSFCIQAKSFRNNQLIGVVKYEQGFYTVYPNNTLPSPELSVLQYGTSTNLPKHNPLMVGDTLKVSINAQNRSLGDTLTIYVEGRQMATLLNGNSPVVTTRCAAPPCATLKSTVAPFYVVRGDTLALGFKFLNTGSATLEWPITQSALSTLNRENRFGFKVVAETKQCSIPTSKAFNFIVSVSTHPSWTTPINVYPSQQLPNLLTLTWGLESLNKNRSIRVDSSLGLSFRGFVVKAFNCKQQKTWIKSIPYSGASNIDSVFTWVQLKSNHSIVDTNYDYTSNCGNEYQIGTVQLSQNGWLDTLWTIYKMPTLSIQKKSTLRTITCTAPQGSQLRNQRIFLLKLNSNLNRWDTLTNQKAIQLTYSDSFFNCVDTAVFKAVFEYNQNEAIEWMNEVSIAKRKPTVNMSGRVVVCPDDSVLIYKFNSDAVWENGNPSTYRYAFPMGYYFTRFIGGCPNTSDTIFVVSVQYPKPQISWNGSRLKSSYSTGNQWFFNDTLLIGQNAQYYTPTATGAVKVSYLSPENCIFFSDTFSVTSSKNLNQLTSKLFPNPTSGVANFQFSQPFTGQLILYSLDGKQLESINLQYVSQYWVDWSRYTSGVYLVQLKSSDGISTTKLILQK